MFDVPSSYKYTTRKFNFFEFFLFEFQLSELFAVPVGSDNRVSTVPAQCYFGKSSTNESVKLQSLRDN